MDIYTLLKKDHQLVSALFEKITAARSDERRKELLQELATELLLHAHTEEATFYAALAKAGGEETQAKLGHAKDEHQELEALLKTVRNTRQSSAKWLVALGALKHAVEHHVKQEEEEIFKKAQKLLGPKEAEGLATEMLRLKKEQQKNMAA